MGMWILIASPGGSGKPRGGPPDRYCKNETNIGPPRDKAARSARLRGGRRWRFRPIGLGHGVPDAIRLKRTHSPYIAPRARNKAVHFRHAPGSRRADACTLCFARPICRERLASTDALKPGAQRESHRPDPRCKGVLDAPSDSRTERVLQRPCQLRPCTQSEHRATSCAAQGRACPSQDLVAVSRRFAQEARGLGHRNAP